MMMDIDSLKECILAVENGKAFVRSYSENFSRGMASGEKEFTVSFIPLSTLSEAGWDGKGWPDVGVECEVSYAGYWVKATAVHVTVIGHVVFEMHGNYAGSVRVVDRAELVRPIRTKEQMERDELIEIILTDGDLSAGMLADVIINAGYRKPENE